MSDVKVQEPGQLIRPKELHKAQIVDLLSRLYGLNITSYKEFVSFDDRNYFVTVDQKCSNEHIANVLQNGYVLKILNSIDSKKLDYVDAMNCMFLHLNNGGVRVSQPQQNNDGAFFSVETFNHGDAGNEVCVVRLFDFIPGKELHRVPYVPRLIYSVGKSVGRLNKVLKSFSHPFYEKHMSFWSLHSVPKLVQYTDVVQDDVDREIVNEVIDAFNREVVPVYNKLTPGIIHGDANEQNILVREVDGQYDVAAFIDAGDAMKSYLSFEVGIVIAYVMMDSKIVDPLDVGGHVLAGYLTETHLNNTDRDVLRVLAASRMVQSLVMGITASNAEPSNEYLLTTSEKGWPCLRNLWRCCKSELYARWESIVLDYENNPIEHKKL